MNTSDSEGRGEQNPSQPPQPQQPPPQQHYSGQHYPGGQPPQAQQYPQVPTTDAGQQYPYAQYPYGQYPYGQPGQTPGWSAHPQPGSGPYPPGTAPSPKRNRGLIVALVAVLVVALGGGATWWAVSQQESAASGSATPEEAAKKLTTTLGNDDHLGLINSLDPAEASVFTDLTKDVLAEMQRLGVTPEDADFNSAMPLAIETKGLTLDPARSERINDHLVITKLTSGTITVKNAFSDAALTPEFREAVQAQKGGVGADQRTLDIGKLYRQTGEPLPIATVNRDGRWYPSLLYTLGSVILHTSGGSWPDQPIPAKGADSPTAAAEQTVQAMLDRDLRHLVELLPPGEMGVLHDLGPVLVEAGAELAPSGVKITRFTTENTEVRGGTRVTLTELGLRLPGQDELTVTKEGGCYTIQAVSSKRLCADTFVGLMQQNITPIPERARPFFEMLPKLLGNVFEQGLGVVTTEVGGRHYVSPLRTFGDLGLTMYRGLTPEMLRELLSRSN